MTTKEKRKEERRRYYLKYKEKINKKNYEYWIANKEKILEQKREYHKQHREEKAEYDNQYYAKNREKRIAKSREYYKKGKQERFIYDKISRKKYPIKFHARDKIHQLTQSGKLKKPSICQKCKSESNHIHAHHRDYTKPLDIIWLCSLCHGIEHREIDTSKESQNDQLYAGAVGS